MLVCVVLFVPWLLFCLVFDFVLFVSVLFYFCVGVLLLADLREVARCKLRCDDPTCMRLCYNGAMAIEHVLEESSKAGLASWAKRLEIPTKKKDSKVIVIGKLLEAINSLDGGDDDDVPDLRCGECFPAL